MVTASARTRIDVAAHVRVVVARTARRLRQEAGSGMSPSKLAALVTLEQHGPMAPSALADHEGIQRPTATRLVARLEEDGVIERAADVQDGRRTLISLSPAGRALLRRSRTRKDAWLAARMRGLSEDEVQTLEHAADILERMLGEGARR